MHAGGCEQLSASGEYLPLRDQQPSAAHQVAFVNTQIIQQSARPAKRADLLRADIAANGFDRTWGCGHDRRHLFRQPKRREGSGTIGEKAFDVEVCIIGFEIERDRLHALATRSGTSP